MLNKYKNHVIFKLIIKTKQYDIDLLILPSHTLRITNKLFKQSFRAYKNV